MLRPQDVILSLKLSLSEDLAWTYESMAHELGLSPSGVHDAVKRAIEEKHAREQAVRDLGGGWQR